MDRDHNGLAKGVADPEAAARTHRFQVHGLLEAHGPLEVEVRPRDTHPGFRLEQQHALDGECLGPLGAVLGDGVERDQHVVVAEAENVAVAEFHGLAAWQGRFVLVQPGAVGAGVLEEIAILAPADPGMVTGDEQRAVRQHEVVVRGAADVAARRPKNDRAPRAQGSAVGTDDPKA